MSPVQSFVRAVDSFFAVLNGGQNPMFFYLFIAVLIVAMFSFVSLIVAVHTFLLSFPVVVGFHEIHHKKLKELGNMVNLIGLSNLFLAGALFLAWTFFAAAEEFKF